MLRTLPVAEVLEVEVCNSRAALDDLDDHIDEGLARFGIHHAHPGDPEVLYLHAV